MEFKLLSALLRTPKPALPKRTDTVSALAFALLLSLAAHPAHAAAQACKEGAKATISGEISKWEDFNGRLWVTINDTSWDCAGFMIAVKRTEKTRCQPGGHGTATGIMTQHDKNNIDGSWSLTDNGPGKGAGMTSTFTCGPRRAEDSMPKK
jgi:hypothetical protein